jgi:plastocyanin
MSARLTTLVLVSALTACGGGDGESNPPIDMAPPVTLSVVDPCPGTVDATITTLAERFDPAATTISQGQVVKFVTTATHPVKAQSGTDATLDIPQNQTKCFRFTAAGTYKFNCTNHSYAGTITVN